MELQAITQEASRKQLVNGEALFVQGDSCEEMFLIKSGRIRLSEIFEDGNELTLDTRNGGDFVGENMFSGEG